MEQILLVYGIPKETVAAITILYRNTKVKVRSPDGDTEYFDIVAGVLQGDTLAPYLFIICLDYVLRTSIDKIKENGFELTKKRSRRYPATTITDADYADDIAILANTPDQAETLLHSLERAAASIASGLLQVYLELGNSGISNPTLYCSGGYHVLIPLRPLLLLLLNAVAAAASIDAVTAIVLSLPLHSGLNSAPWGTSNF